jgi:hypothetical protein
MMTQGKVDMEDRQVVVNTGATILLLVDSKIKAIDRRKKSG